MNPPGPFLKWSAWLRWIAEWRISQIICLVKGHHWDDYYCERCGSQRQT